MLVFFLTGGDEIKNKRDELTSICCLGGPARHCKRVRRSGRTLRGCMDDLKVVAVFIFFVQWLVDLIRQEIVVSQVLDSIADDKVVLRSC